MREDTFHVAACSQAGAHDIVLWWGVVTVRWKLSFSDDASNASAHQAANRRAVRPGASFVDYCLEGAVWCEGLTVGMPGIIPLEAIACAIVFVAILDKARRLPRLPLRKAPPSSATRPTPPPPKDTK